MATVSPSTWTLADLAERFGPMPVRRIRFDPAPGTATEEDVTAIHRREKRLFELIDGILVEKTMGYRESVLAVALASFLKAFITDNNLGAVAGPDGMMRLSVGLVRIPDVSFVAWDRLPGRQIPAEPIPDLAPDLAVEVLSESNTIQEMDEKLEDYFRSGARLVWFVDPKARTVRVFTSADRSKSKLLQQNQTLDGDPVLPGFTLPLRELFVELDKH